VVIVVIDSEDGEDYGEMPCVRWKWRRLYLTSNLYKAQTIEIAQPRSLKC